MEEALSASMVALLLGDTNKSRWAVEGGSIPFCWAERAVDRGSGWAAFQPSRLLQGFVHRSKDCIPRCHGLTKGPHALDCAHQTTTFSLAPGAVKPAQWP